MVYKDSMIADAVRAATLEVGYEKLRGEQQTVIQSYMRGRVTFVSLSTDSGKSLCYCALPLVFHKLRNTPGRLIALVVNLLIALMKDQVRERVDCNIIYHSMPSMPAFMYCVSFGAWVYN